MKIAVGLSGGVDSAVTALLLKQQGHEVTGVTMAIWDNSYTVNKISDKHACFGPDEVEDIKEAENFCNNIGIPYYVYNCAREYHEIVLEYLRKEYQAGRTPNPCVKCNQQVKLAVLPELIKKSGLIFDKFATGHYAKIEQHPETKRFVLKKACDKSKDQTYFLYRLSQEQLSNLMFPLGDYLKSNVRVIAKSNNIKVWNKRDSQNFFCGNYNDLLNFPEQEGIIVHINGRILGKHKGIWNYTIGQRKGLDIAFHEPLYVVKLDKNENQVVVGPKEFVYNQEFLVKDINYIALENLYNETNAMVKIRSTQQEFAALLAPAGNDHIKVTCDVPQSAITPGQSAVFYQDDIVLGGGVIDLIE
jgi:tRNA-uridine 2-sulfurtransferase